MNKKYSKVYNTVISYTPVKQSKELTLVETVVFGLLLSSAILYTLLIMACRIGLI